MKIETFLDGELVEQLEVDDFPTRPNIAGFTTAMLFSPSYMKLVSNSQDRDTKIRLELLTVRLELKPEITIGDLEILKLVWDSLVDSLPDGILVDEDKTNFNEIADSNFMPFGFKDDFKLELKI